MQSFPSLEETSLGVLDYDTVSTVLQQNKKFFFEKTTYFQKKRDTSLGNMLLYMDQVPLLRNPWSPIPI